MDCSSLLKCMSIESVMLSNHLILCLPLLPLSSVFPSIRIFSSESALCVRWPKCWSFSISPSSEYSGLTSFRTDWFDLLAVQETLKSLLQQHNSKTSVLWCSAFFMVHLSHPYMTTGKTVALTRHTFVSKVMSLLFNMLSRFVIAFLLRNKHLLISWLQSLLLSLCGEQVGTFNTVTQGPRLKMVYFFVMLVISKYGFQGLHRGVQRLDALEFCLEMIHNTSDHGKIQSCGSHWTSREAGECEVAHEVLADQYWFSQNVSNFRWLHPEHFIDALVVLCRRDTKVIRTV